MTELDTVFKVPSKPSTISGKARSSYATGSGVYKDVGYSDRYSACNSSHQHEPLYTPYNKLGSSVNMQHTLRKTDSGVFSVLQNAYGSLFSRSHDVTTQGAQKTDGEAHAGQLTNDSKFAAPSITELQC